MTIVGAHHPLRVGLFLSILVLLCSSCERSPSEPVDDRPLITSSAYRNVVLKLTDYDILHITHQAGLDLRSSSVARVGIGVKDSAGYKERLSMPSTYDQNAHAFILHFDLSVAMDSSKIQAPLTIRYYATDSTYTDADTTVDLYKYPYSATDIVLTDALLANGKFQDIARINSKFYFHPLGPEGLYEVDLTSMQKRLLVEYLGDDHIAADSVFVFCDVYHYRIYRYNLQKNSTDLVLAQFPNRTIKGLATFDNRLYVFVSGGSYMYRYAYDGALLDSIAYSGGYYLTVSNGIAYSAEFSFPPADRILRYDLTNRTSLSSVRAPARVIEGIKIYNGQLYFCNELKRFVGAVPLADLD